MRNTSNILAAALFLLGHTILISTAFAQPPLSQNDRLQPASVGDYLDAMQSGGPGKDGIPAIDNPSFWNVNQADEYLDDGDIVFGVHHNGKAKAYPQRILVWHELVNDTVGGKPLSVSYCPLTATAIGFVRGDTTLGVSGNLINSNMVMYDRATDTYWPQILAVGIRGKHRGKALQEHRVIWTKWQNWKQRHPDTRVLSTDTGYMRNYDRDPYGEYNPPMGYYAIGSSRMFPVMNESSAFSDKQTVLGFRTDTLAAAVDLEHLREKKIIQHAYNGTHFLIIYDPGLDTGWVYPHDQAINVDHNELRFADGKPQHQSLEEIDAVNAFKAMWFAWAAYYPETLVLSSD